EVLGPSGPDFPGVVVERTQLRQDQIRLLQVIAANLLELSDSVRGLALDPVDEPPMELGPCSLQQAAIGGIRDKAVEEAERLVAYEGRLVRPDQLFSLERQQPHANVV